MREKFIKWLVSYKTLGDKPADKIAAALDSISDKANNDGIIDKGLFSCNGFVDYARCRQKIQKSNQLSSGEIRNLVLLGDFYQFLELTGIKIEASDVKLANYCKTMKMAYSYKAVLILVMVKLCISNRPCNISDVVEGCINFYKSRSLTGENAEKPDSLFAKTPIDVNSAQKIIINNPVSVLVNDGIILFDRAKMQLRLSSAYSYESSDEALIISACNDRINEYYSKLSPKAGQANDESIEELIMLLDSNLSVFKGNAQYNKCKDIILKIKKRLGIETGKVSKIHQDDTRKIGALVKETMKELSDAEYVFSDDDISNFTSSEWSKKHLRLYYPFFLHVDNPEKISELGKDYLGNKRYWITPYVFNGKTFLITSEWYKESKTMYIDWFNSLR